MSIQFRKVIDSLKLPKEAQEQAEHLLDLPEVKSALARAEKEDLRARVELIRRFEGVPQRHIKAKEQAGEKAQKAYKAVIAAEENLRNAKADHQASLAACYAAEAAEREELAALEKEIQAGRDRRFDDFWLHLDTLEQHARGLLEVWPEHRKTGPFGIRELVYKSNQDDVEHARIALNGAKGMLKDMAMQALSGEEITNMLRVISESLAVSLAPLQLTPPTIDERGMVKAPVPFAGVENIRDRVEAAAA